MIPLIYKLFSKLSDKLSINGYNPFNFFNLILSAVNGTIFTVIIYGSIQGYSLEKMLGGDKDKGFFLVAIVCFLLLLFRNRKLKSIPKMIIFSIISSAFGIIIAFVAFIVFIFLQFFGLFLIGIDPEKQSGGQSSGNSGGGQWTEQFSQTKGTYYTDGQGNFKDQYGNEVYNPQGVTDYDKL